MSIYDNGFIGLSAKQKMLKRSFDLCFSVLGLLVTWWIVCFAWLAASLDTKSNGFFIQARVGRDGRIFQVVKIKTMRPRLGTTTTVTQRGDPRITRLGAFLRKSKIDELPQLWNVLRGDMSFVGPRPDVPGYADHLRGPERALLCVRPGITSPATIFYRNEEALLAEQPNPEEYNRSVIWPNKVRMNLEYIANWSLKWDVQLILKTVFE